ncbi:MAG: glycosyltransferase family 9 protein [Candidatus Obscuribacterales bacterium]|nr:glycosyltransferase family 9 protein [Candidatus Obscuribacterales bacterium]
MRQAPPAASRILVVRYRFIGDTILTVPFLRNLRKAYPQARIDVLVGPQSGEVLQNCPYIDNLIVYDTTRFHKYDSGKGKARSFWSYVFELRKNHYDTAFLLKRSLSSAFLSLLIGCKNRIGYASSGRSFLLTQAVPWNQNIHEVESTLDILRAINIEIADSSMEAWISEKEKQEIFELLPELKSSKTKILFHAAAAHPDKLYPLEKWAEVMKLIAAKEEILPFFAGSEQDNSVYAELESLSGIKGVNTAGKLSLRQSMAMLAQLDLAICTDSGPAHLAAAAQTPTIALFGPTDPERWRPWGEKHKALFDETLSCRPCHYKKTCENRPCLTELKAERVAQEVMKMLGNSRHRKVVS